MEFSLPLNLDDGFIRRQCPSCNRQFKWHHGPIEDRPADAVDPPMYHCPYCGRAAPTDDWWTDDQAAYISEAATGPASRAVNQELERMFRGLNSKRLKTSFKPAPEPPPSPPREPADMQTVQSPCHAWEPIKVLDDWQDPLHCIVCGDRYCV